MSEPAQSSDEDLVRRVRDGDGEAARLLFDRHAATLRAQVKKKLPNELRAKVGASDVIQEAYLAAFLRMTQFEDRGDGSFERWVRGILDHKLLDEVRRHAESQKRAARRETRIRTRDERAHLAARQPSPSAEAASVEEAAELRAAIDGLKPEFADVLRHIHLDGKTLVATAALMGRSADAVEKLYGRALARLSDRLRGRADGRS
jgi:RNA polymerase sigma-70 factor (ECF subfamily)